MPRMKRLVLAGVPHHVTQRGNNRQDVFFTKEDRRVYLDLLKVHARRFRLRVLAYCLMRNHVHLVATPETKGSLSKAVGRTNFLYAQYVNRLHGRSGHLWQDRFFSCALEGRHLGAAVRYVERNPVRGKLVRTAWEYRWSSAAAHVRGEDAAGLLDMGWWRRLRMAGEEWKRMLRRADDAEAAARLRLSTSRGRPLGTDRFLARLEAALGRRLRPLPVGRPRKREEPGSTAARCRGNR